MTLAALLVVATLGPQAPPIEAPPPTEASLEASASPAATQDSIATGLVAFRKRQFAKAEAAFQAAFDGDPTSAPAAFYLGYTIYKRTEGRGRNNPGKAQSANLFAKAYELDPAFRPVWAAPRR